MATSACNSESRHGGGHGRAGLLRCWSGTSAWRCSGRVCSAVSIRHAIAWTVRSSRSSSGGRSVQTGFIEFAREVMSLKKCRGHPSIVEFRNTHADKRDSDGDTFIVMEYAGRMNLRVYMVSRGLHGLPFREAEVRGIMRQLLAGAERSHQAGILHRDIKPKNVVVDDGTAYMIRNTAYVNDGKKKKLQPTTEEITCKICDFGMSEPMTQKKREYSPLATSDPYRAPELFLGSTDYDGRIDTWGLGCIMAELLFGTGGAFFEGKTEGDVLTNMLEVVGAKGIKDWLGPYQPGSPHWGAEKRVHGCPEIGRLREVFPEKVLSQAGFEVLSGLLSSSPRDRLTAAEALQKPWFTDEGMEKRRRGGRLRRGSGACFCHV
ncbi:putative cyclin-dependent kinase F-2 [Dichanthelium oligosanthes]|uniref:Putative cyclin-dependent kinase F-2 n=1 Tax=Dichanthelium oligosanthes TaxID=888268 RepID=A0A1E5VLP8_9POAL|nr:putative cyclin-dependent kinase F-2 [Dichanthelium oligosanthes]